MSGDKILGGIIVVVLGLFLLAIWDLTRVAGQCADRGGEQIPHVGCVAEGSDGTLRRVR